MGNKTDFEEKNLKKALEIYTKSQVFLPSFLSLKPVFSDN